MLAFRVFGTGFWQRTAVLAVGGLAFLGAAGCGLLTQEYSVTNLGEFLEYDCNDIVAINDSGMVIGTREGRPVLFDGTVWRDLGTLGGKPSWATDINNAGLIVGQSAIEGDTCSDTWFPPLHGFLWRDGELLDLNTVVSPEAGGVVEGATAINDNGQIVGSLGTGSIVQGYLLAPAPGYTVTLLGTLGGGTTYPEALNNLGQVVGSSSTASVALHAFLWQEGVMIDLGVPPGFGHSSALGINDAGQVVGEATNWEGFKTPDYTFSGVSSYQAFLWEAGVMTVLPTRTGESSSAAQINNRGDVVGYALSPEGCGGYAVLWRKGKAIDLNDKLPFLSPLQLTEAVAINDAGQIVALGYSWLDWSWPTSHVFLLTPTARDVDSDGIRDAIDNCPYDYDPDRNDSDGDNVGDACDNCPGAPNLVQSDVDADGLGDACDDDDDSDGVLDVDDNCPSRPNLSQDDADADGAGDVCDLCQGFADSVDLDADGVADGCDNCPGMENDSQQDADRDDVGDACDDDDGDGYPLAGDN